MSPSHPVQLSFSMRGWCQRCVGYEICGAQQTECHAFQTHPNEVLNPDHPELLSWLAQIRGLRFDDVVARPLPGPGLPAYVPVIEGRGSAYVDAGVLDHVAVTLADVFSECRLVPVSAAGIRAKLRLPASTRITLLGVGRDRLIERMWGEQSRVFEAIAALEFDLVTAFNYSIWYDQPRMEHLVNLKRSLLTFERLQSLGVPVVPHVYWYNRVDLRRWADWLCANPVPAIALNLQTGRSQSVWKRLLDGLQWIGERFPKDLQYLVIGPSTYERMSSVLFHLRRVTFCNKDAYVMACKRQIKTWHGTEFGAVQCNEGPPDIFRHNAGLFSRVASGDPPPPFAILDGFGKSGAVQARLPGMSTLKDEQLAELPLLAA